ncbi:MAG: hypothetical protein DRQ62_14245 [Gammaproteobacteria bacterium]|nr:MAG: hypothetical protein DRQ62_14245 [Gammaproteobacteria bacterium]
MIRSIVTKKTTLALPSEEIHDQEKIEDIIVDLIETAKYRATIPPGCMGLAANQIGELYRIFIIWYAGEWIPMINPVLETVKGPQGYAKEGCLSRPGIHTKKRRYKKIHVSYTNWPNGDPVEHEKYGNFTARVIQHEHDHLNGVFI